MSVARATAALAMLPVLGLAACGRADMAAQPKAKNWDRSVVFADQSSMRLPVAGTEPRGEPNLPVAQPAVITASFVARGRERYDIFCTPCHGQTGDGHGMIVQRGFPPSPPLTDAGLVKADAAFHYDVISNGHGVMYGFAERIPPADRWAIVAYVRALQLSQNAPAQDLASADRAALDAKP